MVIFSNQAFKKNYIGVVGGLQRQLAQGPQSYLIWLYQDWAEGGLFYQLEYPAPKKWGAGGIAVLLNSDTYWPRWKYVYSKWNWGRLWA